LASTTRTTVQQRGGTFVDLTGIFDQELAPTYADDAVHYTPLGNLRLADALAPLVEERLNHLHAASGEPMSTRPISRAAAGTPPGARNQPD
jgi:hypothetical protein